MQVLGQSVSKQGAVELLLPAAHHGVPQKWGWCSSAPGVWHLAGQSGSSGIVNPAGAVDCRHAAVCALDLGSRRCWVRPCGLVALGCLLLQCSK